jgi:hypothetical protein
MGYYAVWMAVLLLIILHQDNWLWENSTLACGFLPVTMLYHMGISLSAMVVWYLATRYAWPLPDEPRPEPLTASAPRTGDRP